MRLEHQTVCTKKGGAMTAVDDEHDSEPENLELPNEDFDDTDDPDEIALDLGLLESVDAFRLADVSPVTPVQANEFTCTECFLVVPAHARGEGTVCRDCL